MQNNRFLTQLENKYEIMLASRSERRKQILTSLGITYKIIDWLDIDETAPETLNAVETAKYISNKKAQAYISHIAENQLIIACDTIVFQNNRIIGKPKDREQAKEYLQLLSGAVHTVITGVTLMTKQKTKIFDAKTQVWFDTLTEEEIDFYIDTFQPYDKAGAYGVQEWIGMIGCERIEGSYFNIMGMPIQLIYKKLHDFI